MPTPKPAMNAYDKVIYCRDAEKLLKKDNPSVEDIQSAIEFYDMVLESDPQYPSAQTGIASAFSLLDKEASQEFFNTYREVYKKRGNDLYQNAAGATQGPERDALFSKALANYEFALSIDPHDVDALIGKGDALRSMRQDSRANEAYTAAVGALDHHSQNSNVHIKLGGLYSRLGNHDLAIQHYQAVIERNPYQAEKLHALKGLESSYFQKKDYRQALEAYQTIQGIDPNYKLSTSHQEALKGEAKRLCDTAKVDIKTKDYVSAEKNYRNAVDFYTAVLKTNPDDKVAKKGLKVAQSGLTKALELQTPKKPSKGIFSGLKSAYRGLKSMFRSKKTPPATKAASAAPPKPSQPPKTAKSQVPKMPAQKKAATQASKKPAEEKKQEPEKKEAKNNEQAPPKASEKEKPASQQENKAESAKKDSDKGVELATLTKKEPAKEQGKDAKQAEPTEAKEAPKEPENTPESKKEEVVSPQAPTAATPKSEPQNLSTWAKQAVEPTKNEGIQLTQVSVRPEHAEYAASPTPEAKVGNAPSPTEKEPVKQEAGEKTEPQENLDSNKTDSTPQPEKSKAEHEEAVEPTAAGSAAEEKTIEKPAEGEPAPKEETAEQEEEDDEEKKKPEAQGAEEEPENDAAEEVRISPPPWAAGHEQPADDLEQASADSPEGP